MDRFTPIRSYAMLWPWIFATSLSKFWRTWRSTYQMCEPCVRTRCDLNLGNIMVQDENSTQHKRAVNRALPATRYYSLQRKIKKRLPPTMATSFKLPISYVPSFEEYQLRARCRQAEEDLLTSLPEGFPAQLHSPLVWEGNNFSDPSTWTYSLCSGEIGKIIFV